MFLGGEMKFLILLCFVISITYSSEYNICKYNMGQYWLNEVMVDKPNRLDSLIEYTDTTSRISNFIYEDDSTSFIISDSRNDIIGRIDTLVYRKTGNTQTKIYDTGLQYIDSIKVLDTLIQQYYWQFDSTKFQYFQDSLVIGDLSGVFDGTTFTTPLVGNSGDLECTYEANVCSCQANQQTFDSLDIIQTDYGWEELRYLENQIVSGSKFYVHEEPTVSLRPVNALEALIILDGNTIRLNSGESFTYDVMNINGQIVASSINRFSQLNISELKSNSLLILKTENSIFY